MRLNPEDYLKRAADAEASASETGDPVLRGKFLQLAKAVREIAKLLIERAATANVKRQNRRDAQPAAAPRRASIAAWLSSTKLCPIFARRRSGL
jgi:hypothetical protein